MLLEQDDCGRDHGESAFDIFGARGSKLGLVSLLVGAYAKTSNRSLQV